MKQKPEDVCQEIMEQLLKHGFSYQVPRKEVENAMILANIGYDERTWKRWIRVLEVHEYLKSVNQNVYEMNVAKIPHLFELLRKIPQTHLLGNSLSQGQEHGEGGA